jgi:hypothetical protein
MLPSQQIHPFEIRTFCVLEPLAAAQTLSIAGHTLETGEQGNSLQCPHSRNWRSNLHTQAVWDSSASLLVPAVLFREELGTCRGYNVICCLANCCAN